MCQFIFVASARESDFFNLFSTKEGASQLISDSNMDTSATASSKGKDSDKSFLLRLKSGDESAFGEMVRTNWDRIYGRANSLLSNHQDAEEVAQDTFVRARNSILKFRGECSISTWLYHIATNLARNKHWYWWRRKRGCSVSFEAPVSEDSSMSLSEVISNSDPIPCDQIASEEFMSLRPKAMEMLPQKYSEVIRLRNELNLSYEEIAQHMGISVGTVKSRLSRARDYLRLELEKMM